MPDNDWTKGKCGLKVLQYMAAGLPVVSSRSGANADIIDHGVTGFLPRNDDEWFQSVKKLMKDPELIQKLGKAGQKKVRDEYSVDAVYEKMKASLNRIEDREP
jgi:glycosyltransferase involved in cell wall biosynthesis